MTQLDDIFNDINKTYKEKTSITGKKQIIGGSPIQNTLFKVYSNTIVISLKTV